MNNTSSQDEFAKWAKLRRRHDKTLEDFEAASMYHHSTFKQEKEREQKLTYTNNRQSSKRTQILLRLVHQNRPLDKHQRPQAFPSIPLQYYPRLRSPAWLVSLLRRMGSVVPQGADGICERAGLEFCVWGCGQGYG